MDVSEKDKIFVVQENPYFVAVVYPKENCDVKTRPDVIVQTVRMTKKRSGQSESWGANQDRILCSLKSQMLESTNVLILAQNLESTNL